MSVINTNEVILPSDENTLKELVASIQEVVQSKVRQASEQDYQKESIAAIAEKYELPKDFIKQMATWKYDESKKDRTIGKVESFSEAYDALFGN